MHHLQVFDRRPKSLARTIALILVTILLSACSNRSPVAPSPRPNPPVPTPVVPKPTQPVTYDLVLKGGQIIDGSGSAAVTGDIAVVGDRIVAVGKLPNYTSGRQIDISGLIIAPGFINPHSHTHDSEINPFEDWDAKASLMQGITTELGGVDGRSPLPIGAELDRIGQIGSGVNFGLFVGQGSVRQSVVGSGNGAASPAQLDEMKAMVRRSMQDGAFGVSTGLEYRPGLHAGTEEIASLVAETRAFNGIYSTHLRSEGDRIIEAIREALEIARIAGVPLNLSHFKIVKHQNWGKLDQVVALVQQAIKGGQKVFADVYPYLAPDYAINRPLDQWSETLPPEYLVITSAADSTIVGLTLAQVAQRMQVSSTIATQRLLASDPGIAVVSLVSSEQAMVKFYQSDWSVVSTDGEAQPKLDSPAQALGLSLHRRSYGSYPMLLGHYVRERRILTIETMVRKMTGAVADQVGIAERGYLKPGQYADLVVFSETDVADLTSWVRPQEYPAGIRYVLINGAMAVDNGKHVQGRFGRIIRQGK